MSRGEDGRFRKGASGNKKGRPRKQQPPPASAFDIIFDKKLTVTQGGVEREFTVDEALQRQTYQDALKGSKPATRQVLRMIEKRERVLAERFGASQRRVTIVAEHNTDNADEAMRLLGIVECEEPGPDGRPGPR